MKVGRPVGRPRTKRGGERGTGWAGIRGRSIKRMGCRESVSCDGVLSSATRDALSSTRGLMWYILQRVGRGQ